MFIVVCLSLMVICLSLCDCLLWWVDVYRCVVVCYGGLMCLNTGTRRRSPLSV